MATTTAPGGFDPASAAATNTSGAFAGSNPYTDLYGLTSAEQTLPVTVGGNKTTVGSAIQQFDGAPVSTREAMAQQLINSGYLTRASSVDPVAVSQAYVKLLHYAAVNPSQNLDTVLQDSLDYYSATGGAAGNSSGAKVTIDLTNPLDVQYAANAVAQKLIGRNLTPDEATAIAQQMRSEELSSGQTKAQATLSQLNASLGQGTQSSSILANVQPTSVDAMTQQYLATNNPGEYQGHELLSVFQAIQQKVATDAQGTGPKAAAGPIRVI